MAEYIEKQKAIDNIEKSFDKETILNRFIRKIAISAVRRMEPADVRPVRRGRWIVKETAFEDTEARCSECGFTTLINEPGNGLHMLSDLNYCPGCGSYNCADMRGGDAE